MDIDHTAEIVARERTTERWLLPFGIAMAILIVGFAVMMLVLYR